MDEKIDREKLIERIKALMALGDTSRNNSEAEAATALKKMQELLQKHNLDISEISFTENDKKPGQEVVDEVAVEWRKSSLSTWENSLVAMIGIACETKPYLYKEYVPGTKSGMVFKFRFIGTPWDVAISKEMLIYLHSTIKKLSVKNYPNSLPQQRCYMEGCCHRLGERIREQNEAFKRQQVQNQKYALLVINKKDAIEIYAEKLGLVKAKRKQYGGKNWDPHAFEHGMRDANKMDIGNDNRIKSGDVAEPNQLT